MRIWLALVAIILVPLAAWRVQAGPSPSSPAPSPSSRDWRTFPPGTMGVHIQGGIQGRNDYYVVDLASGSVYVRRRGEEKTSRLTAAEVSALRQAVKKAGFYQWKTSYLPTGRAADAITTRIVVNDGKASKTVLHADPADAPAGFRTLARRFELLSYAPYWHSSSYLYVTGRLEYSQLEGGFWTLVYATGDEAASDKYGGKVVLVADKASMRAFKPGDLVLVTGAVDNERMGIEMAGTYYKVNKIEPLR